MTERASKVSPSGIGRGLSLQYKLPLLITGLLLALVLIGSVLAYREVRGAAVMAATGRLERVSQQLSEILAQSTATTLTRFREAAALPDVRRAAAAGLPPGADVPDALARLIPSDTSTPLELWSPAGDVTLRLGRYPSGWGAEERAVVREAALAAPDTGGYGSLFMLAGSAFLWVSFPVEVGTGDGGGEGRLARLARIGDGGGGSGRIGELVGPGSRVHLVDRDGGPWISLDGEIERAPTSLPLDSAATFTREDGQAYVARAALVPGQTFAVVVESPLRDIMARPATFLRRIMIAAAVLILVGALGAWLLSLSITRPLRTLNRAAIDIAAGDYSSRVELDRRDELGALAAAFSHMANEVEASHAELRTQYEEQRDLAAQLELTNRRMMEAIVSAEQARTEAENASRAKSDFLATMSHELRTPINAIIGYADLLQLEIPGPLTTEQREQLGRLRASSRHLLTLVDEVLDLARVEAGRLRVSIGSGSAVEAVRAAAAVIDPDAAAKQIRLVPPSGADDVVYAGDPQRVQQILINLLSNAVKFTPRGGTVETRVWSEVEASGRADVTGDVRPDPDGDGEDGPDAQEWSCFTIADTGIGIDPAQQEAIFQPFVQLESGLTRTVGGAGLGLAISRRLARLMGGELTVASEPGRGSRFTLRLPRALSAAEVEPG